MLCGKGFLFFPVLAMRAARIAKHIPSGVPDAEEKESFLHPVTVWVAGWGGAGEGQLARPE